MEISEEEEIGLVLCAAGLVPFPEVVLHLDLTAGHRQILRSKKNRIKETLIGDSMADLMVDSMADTVVTSR